MRLEQRIKKLESALGRRQQAVADDVEIERTDEEEADWTGDLLWWPKGANMDRWPGYFTSDYGHCNGPLGAWKDAARLARQQGHTDYHVGLRPYALAVWLQWKSLMKHRPNPGRWVWDVAPRFNSVTMEEFVGLPIEVKAELLREQGQGHWSK